MKIEGFTTKSKKEFIATFIKVTKGVKVASRKGLMKAGVIIRKKAKDITPRDTGALIGSMYGPTPIKNIGDTIGIELGYTAKYAPWVHEMPGVLKGQPRRHFGKTRAGKEFGGGTLKGKYWDPNGEPKFLEKPLLSSGNEILRQIDMEVKKVKGKK
jgi:hypothetical protein